MLVLRRQQAGETDGELLALAVLSLSGAMVLAWVHWKLPTPVCPFHAITGQPCLTCGGTRCLRNVLAGHLVTGFEWNPLVFLGTVAAGLFAVYAAIVTTFRLPRIRIGTVSPRAALVLRLTVVAVLAANWIYLIFRFSRGG